MNRPDRSHREGGPVRFAASFDQTDAMPSITPEALDRLRAIDTPTVCNVIELFDVRPRNTGFLDGRVRSCFPKLAPMVGFAAPACFRSDAAPSDSDAYGSLERQLEQFERLPGPAVVVIQDLDDPPVGAVFGEVMCSTYRAFGAAGLVTNGGGRDLPQVEQLDFPVFTGSTICAHAYCHLLHVGLPVRVGGVTIVEGELIHGDADGVTTIPVELAADIADVAPEFIAAEAIILDYLKTTSEPTRDEYAARRRAFQAEVAAIRKRVARKHISGR